YPFANLVEGKFYAFIQTARSFVVHRKLLIAPRRFKALNKIRRRNNFNAKRAKQLDRAGIYSGEIWNCRIGRVLHRDSGVWLSGGFDKGALQMAVQLLPGQIDQLLAGQMVDDIALD